MSTAPNSSDINNAVSQIEANYQIGLADWQAMQDDAAAQKAWANNPDIKALEWIASLLGIKTSDPNYDAEMQAIANKFGMGPVWAAYVAQTGYGYTNGTPDTKVGTLQQDINAKEKDLESRFPGAQDLVNSINALLTSIEQMSLSGISWGDYENDLMLLFSTLDTLFSSLQTHLKAEEDAQLINADPNADGKDTAYLMSLSEDMLQQSYAEGTLLNNLSTSLSHDYNAYHKAKDDAQADKNSIRWWDEWFSNGDEREARDNEIIQNANTMMKLITNVTDSISSELASLTSDDLAQVAVVIQSLQKQVLAILADATKSAAEKIGAVMFLFVLICGYLGQVQQFAAKEKAENEEKMSQASIDGSQMSIQDTQMQTKELEDNLKYAAIMGKLMKAVQIVGGALMTLLAPGVGTALLMALVTVLEATGVMDKLVNALSKSMGNLGAEIFVTGLEMIVTMGGGAILDKALQAAVKAAVKAVTEVVEKIVSEIIEKIVQNVAKEAAEVGAKMSQESLDALQNTLSNAFTKGVESTTSKIVTQFFKQNGITLLGKLLWNGAYKGVDAGVQAAVKITEKAVNEAVNVFIEEFEQTASKLVEDMGKGEEIMVEDLADLTGQLDKAGEKTANSIVAKATNVTGKDAAEKVGKETAERSGTRAAFVRGAFTLAYGIGANNILVDTAKQIGQGKMSDDEWDKLIAALQALQQILAMIAQMLGSGVFSQVAMEGSPTTALKLFNLFQIVPAAGGAVGNYGEYDANSRQADVVTAVAKTQAAVDIINYLESEIVKRQQKEEARDTKEQSQISQSTEELSKELFKYMDASSQALEA